MCYFYPKAPTFTWTPRPLGKGHPEPHPWAPTAFRRPHRVKPSFVIFDIRALWRWPGCQKLQM